MKWLHGLSLFAQDQVTDLLQFSQNSNKVVPVPSNIHHPIWYEHSHAILSLGKATLFVAENMEVCVAKVNYR